MPAIEIVQADLEREDHQRAVLDLVNAYAQDPMGAGQSLPPENLRRLIPGLREHPTTLIFLAYQDHRPIGIAVCFVGFSTFAAQPLINIHDLAILPAHRGQGIGRQLLAEVERKARDMECCKLTLEVQENNHRARGVYRATGFTQTVYEADAGGALFLSKRL
jgi:ribosomal protein S18 acetylase RimI-like enzyme